MIRGLLEKILGREAREREAESRLLPYLSDEIACAVLRIVLENPGVSCKGVAAKAHTDSVEAGKLLVKLIDAGLVTLELGDRAGYFITEDAKPAMVRYLPLNYQCPGMMRE